MKALAIDVSARAIRRRTAAWMTSRDDDRSADLDARMIWSALSEPGDGIAGALVAHYGASRALEIAQGSFEDTRDAGIAATDLATARRRWRPRFDDAPFASERGERSGASPVTPLHPSWPARLDALDNHAPICVWVRGEVRALGAPAAVALVGARAATSYGEHIASELAAEVATAGVAVVSGGAYGIDGSAHRAALSAGGVTTAWMAGGVDRAYPAGHRDLLERIVERGGAVAADVPCGSAPTKWRFLARNRLIAAGSDATVIVEAGWRSGSLNTAGHAASLGRPLGAVPGPVTSAASAGCHRLLREYGAVCVTSSSDVRELIGRADEATSGAHGEVGGRTDEVTRVTDAISSRVERSVDDIARRAGMSPQAVEAILGLLALEGRAERSVLGGWRSHTPGPEAASRH